MTSPSSPQPQKAQGRPADELLACIAAWSKWLEARAVGRAELELIQAAVAQSRAVEYLAAYVGKIEQDNDRLRAAPSVERPAPEAVAEGSKDLRDALEYMVYVVKAAGVQNLSRGVQLGQVSWAIKMDNALLMAAAALTRSGER